MIFPMHQIENNGSKSQRTIKMKTATASKVQPNDNNELTQADQENLISNNDFLAAKDTAKLM